MRLSLRERARVCWSEAILGEDKVVEGGNWGISSISDLESNLDLELDFDFDFESNAD